MTLKRSIRLQRRKDCFWGGNGIPAAAVVYPNHSRQEKLQTKAPSTSTEPHSKAATKSVSAPNLPVFDEDLLDSSDYNRASSSTSNILNFPDTQQPNFSRSSSSSGGMNNIDDATAGLTQVSLNREELVAKREAVVQEKVKEAFEF